METETKPTAQPIKRAPLLNNTLLLFMGAMVLANIASHMYDPLLPLYLKDLNASVTQIGLFFTIAQIIPLALQILGGWISDSLGRLRSIAFGSLAGILGYVGLILAPTWQWVLVGMAFSAVTRSLIGPSFSAFIAEQSAEENRARVYGITEAIFMVVAVIGPPLGGWLADQYGFKIMLLWSGLLYVIATLIRIGMARVAARGTEANPDKLTINSLKISLGALGAMILSGGIVTWILITDGIRDIAFNLSFNLFPVYMEEIGGLTFTQIGWLESIFAIFMMLTSIPAGWLADRRGERLGIILGFFLQFVALMAFLQFNGFWGYGAAWAVFGVGIGLMSPAYQSVISKAIPEKLRGTAFGLFSTSLGVVSLPAPAIGGQIWQRYSPQAPFRITAWLSLLATIPVWRKFVLPPNGNGKEELPNNE